jgi:hypothetical protein
MRETRQSGSEGGEGDLPDPYTSWAPPPCATAGVPYVLGIPADAVSPPSTGMYAPLT